MKKNIFITFVFFTSIYSQNDSTFISFYPLNIGNQWQYEVIINPVWEPDTSFVHHFIIGDTVLNNDKRYFTRIILPDSVYRFERFDSSSSKVYVFDSTRIDSNYEYCLYDFSRADTITQDYVGNINIIANQILLYKAYIFWQWTYKFSEGFGLSSFIYQGVDGYFEYETLNWAKINSIEYGNFVTKIVQQENRLPQNIKLIQNYPNPFNPSTTIKFTLPEQKYVVITVYNNLGEKIAMLINRVVQAGNHEIEFNAKNISSGVYFYYFQAGEYQDVKKMILIK